jgi:hypothetical protein
VADCLNCFGTRRVDVNDCPCSDCGPIVQTCPECGFECVLCGKLCEPENGAYDAIERMLGDGERGVCDECSVKLPQHVHEWAEQREGGACA